MVQKEAFDCAFENDYLDALVGFQRRHDLSELQN